MRLGAASFLLSVQEIHVSKHARFLSGNDNKGSFFKIAENWQGAIIKSAFSNTHIFWKLKAEKMPFRKTQ